MSTATQSPRPAWVTLAALLCGRLNQRGVDSKEWASLVIRKGLAGLETLACETAETFAVGSELSVADACLIPQVRLRTFTSFLPAHNFPWCHWVALQRPSLWSGGERLPQARRCGVSRSSTTSRGSHAAKYAAARRAACLELSAFEAAHPDQQPDAEVT